MRRAPGTGVDLTVYLKAIPLLVRNPSIIVVPLLMAVAGILIGLVLAPAGGGLVGYATGGIAGLVVQLLQLFGVGAACIVADGAWRRGRSSFDDAWTEARRRAGDILFAALLITFVFGIIQYVGMLIGLLALVLAAVAFFFLIWAIPAVAVGGLSGGDAIQVSIDRVRANPLSAAITAIVAALATYGAMQLSLYLTEVLYVYTGVGIVDSLIGALVMAIADGYIALIITKTYTDASFGR
ncbi:MAG TPA: hypothetical protein VHS78_04790 [Candidatus Elarobacter sp.]|jgi:hypothetical protein|nr:hypothetical protein [Candidatus Elarobacter sp.]